jgi:hypothetical protein
MQDQLSSIYAILSGANNQAMQQVGILGFLFLMLVSLASSLFISFLYVQFFSTRATGSQVHRAFPLLGISVTAIFISIQFSLPLSLGLLGALSIVRFRTPIKEPEEIGFIMLVIAAAIACATYKIAFLGVLFAAALLALVIQRASRLLRSTLSDGVIVIAVPEAEYGASAEAIAAVMTKRLSKARLESVSKNDSQMVLSYNFQGITQPALLALESDLRAAARQSSFNIFFNRPYPS